jgi:predicted TIM-barrel fold metal-dependent hydrolase
LEQAFFHRRDLLLQATSKLAAAAIVTKKYLVAGDLGTESPLKRRNFIDAHVHLWTRDFLKYPLAATVKPTEMEPPVFLPSDILQHAAPSGVSRIVLVQMSYYGTDNSYMLEAIRQSPRVFRGIAVVDPESERPEATMRKIARKGVRGFRIYPPDGPSKSWLTGEGFRKMFRCGAQDRLALCLLVNPQDLVVVDRQCESFPETPVVIDHMARIGRNGPIGDADTRALCALARHPQLKVKVSAFYALGARTPPHLDLVPLIKRLFESFGSQRLMWGSDCPFQVDHEAYEDSISLVRDRLDFLSSSDKQWMLCRTAEESFFQ